MAVDGVSKWSEINQMKLNINKTQAMHINTDIQIPIKINNQEIITTTSYKYLGTHINTELDWDYQWECISKKFHSTLYLIKTLKNLSFKKEILVNIYKSIVLNHIISNVATLCSTSKRVKDEMESLQRRFLKTIGITNKENPTYKIVTIDELIEKHGKRRLVDILTNSDHPITKSLEKRESITRKGFPFKINKCKSEMYQNSYLQQFLRKLEKEGLIKQANHTTTTNPTTKEEEKVVCEICNKAYKGTRGVNQHKRMTHKQTS